ncbi:MAG: transposase, partial [Nitrososphaeraceae archaeon]
HCSSQEGGQQIGFDGHKKTKGSKIQVAVTSQCLPIAIDLGSGNEHESRKLIPLLNYIQIKNNNGRPKSRPERVWADTKYHTFLVLIYLYNRRIRAQIKERRNTKSKQGRPHVFLYREYRKIRSSVERFFGWLKSFRRIQTRYERLASTYLGFIQLGCIMILMKVIR